MLLSEITNENSIVVGSFMAEMTVQSSPSCGIYLTI
jgi:hypothetical protein